MVNRAIHESISWTIDSTQSGDGDGDSTHPINDHPVEDPRTLPTLHALLSPYPKSIYGDGNSQGVGGQESIDFDTHINTTSISTSTSATKPTTTSTTTTATASASVGADTPTAVPDTPLTTSPRSPLVYVHIYNPVRTYLKQVLKHKFHVSFGDEDRDRTCVLTPPVPVSYHDYISPFQVGGGGDLLSHCRTVGVEYFTFRVSESTVRWFFEELLSHDVRKYLLDGGIVELAMAEK